MKQHLPTMRRSKSCAAPREVMYDMLADLRSHLRWGGAEQSDDFRLLSMDAPDGRMLPQSRRNRQSPR